MTDRDQRRQARRTVALSLALLLVFSVAAMAEEDCGWPPDLWVPPHGTVLSDGRRAVQRVSGDVCQGEQVTIEVTIANPSCGDAGPFDVVLTYGETGRVIDVVRIDGIDGCDYITFTVLWDTTGALTGLHDVSVCADTGDEIVELNEGNNCLVIARDLMIRPNTPYIVAEKLLVDMTGGTVQPGDSLRYEVTIWNYGCADMEDNPGHEFVDELPGGMSPTGQITATSGVAQVMGNSIVWDGSIPAGGSVTIKYRADLDPDLEPETVLCNQGVVYWDSTGDGTHDERTLTDDPTTPEPGDPTCLTVDEPVTGPLPLSGTIDAPTLSEWGMIATIVGFGVALGVQWSRRQRKALEIRG